MRSLPALTAWFGWNVYLNAPFTSYGSSVPKAENTATVAEIKIETKTIILKIVKSIHNNIKDSLRCLDAFFSGQYQAFLIGFLPVFP